MKNKCLMLLLTIFLCTGTGIYAQVGDLTGTDICGDGLQSTNIGISGADPSKYYALYHDNKMIQVRRANGESNEHVFSFGVFNNVGSYSAVVFDKVLDGFPARLGKPVNGKITISPVPVLFMRDTLKIKSGKLLHYVPHADLQGTTYTWSAYVKYGKVSGYRKKGDNAIDDTLRVEGDSAACIVYSITPHGGDHIISCDGDTRDLVVIVRP